VKKFQFPLGRLLEFRRLQEEMERAKLARLAGEVRQIEQRRAELAQVEHRAADDVRRSVEAGSEPTVGPLSALPAFRQRVRRLDRRMEAQEAELSRQMQAQRATMLEARQRSEVLERCREKSFAEWKSGLEREMETLAGELHLAKWKRRR
jgi:flagellar export protein FliJ